MLEIGKVYYLPMSGPCEVEDVSGGLALIRPTGQVQRTIFRRDTGKTVRFRVRKRAFHISSRAVLPEVCGPFSELRRRGA